MMVDVDNDFLITNVKCGGDGTIFLTDQGAMLVCGSNTRNKLGLNDPGGLFAVKVLTFGRNCEAQLGRGNCKSTSHPVLVRSMSNRVVTMISCGSTFTVAGTIENALYLWGTRAVSPSTRPTT
ncbi:hypothetical protein Anas_01739, partial [Armadillidium nasatum]